LRQRCLSTVFAYVGVAEEELRAQVILGHDFVVCECDGAYAGEDKVLGDFVGKGFDGDEQDVGGTDLLLRLNAPQADLTVVKGDFICARGLVLLLRLATGSLLPAEILSASAMAATVWLAASSDGNAPGNAPLVAGGSIAEDSVRSVMVF
jgi:hypothetical protein